MSRNSCGDTVWIYERSLFVSLHGRLVRFRVSLYITYSHMG